MLCPHSIYVFCIYLRINSDLCHLQHKLIGFITEMKSVYSAVRTGFLNKAVCASSVKGLMLCCKITSVQCEEPYEMQNMLWAGNIRHLNGTYIKRCILKG